MIRPALVGRTVLAVLASAAALLFLARASASPLPYHAASASRLRLSWSAHPERIEVCRTLSAEELAERPEHMRQRVECDGRFATYTLRVEADGRVLAESIVRGGGLRHDRPIHLLRDHDLPAGAHQVRISFTRRERTDGDTTDVAVVAPAAADTGIFAGRAERERTERARRQRAALPATLLLDTTVVLSPRSVTVVTFDNDRRVLRMIDAPTQPSR